MKLAEALRLKNDLEAQLNKMYSRVRQAAIVEEDVETTSEVYSLIQGHETLSKKLLRLKVAINKANMENTVTYPSYYDNIKNFSAIGDSGSNNVPEKVSTSSKVIMEALAERERLSSDISAHSSFLSASEVSVRYRVEDVKKKSTIDSAKLRKRIEAMSKYLRLADTKIQENNWVIEFDFE